jgi:hypothetical protein
MVDVLLLESMHHCSSTGSITRNRSIGVRHIGAESLYRFKQSCRSVAAFEVCAAMSGPSGHSNICSKSAFNLAAAVWIECDRRRLVRALSAFANRRTYRRHCSPLVHSQQYGYYILLVPLQRVSAGFEQDMRRWTVLSCCQASFWQGDSLLDWTALSRCPRKTSDRAFCNHKNSKDNITIEKTATRHYLN